jgi:mutator protein MutT
MIRVVAAIIEEHRTQGRDGMGSGRFLICQRAGGGAFGGKWEFPGGKMRAGETPWSALERELREELAIEARVGAAVYRVRHRYFGMAQDVEITFFRAEVYFGVPRNVCFERVRRVRRSDLARFDFLAADRYLVTRLVGGTL